MYVVFDTFVIKKYSYEGRKEWREGRKRQYSEEGRGRRDRGPISQFKTFCPIVPFNLLFLAVPSLCSMYHHH